MRCQTKVFGLSYRPVRINHAYWQCIRIHVTDAFVGIEGDIEPAVPLAEEEMFGAGKAPPVTTDEHIGGTSESSLQDHAGEVIEELGDPSTEGLSLIMKLGLGGILVAACYAWVRAHSPRSSKSNSGRHGAYEKSGSLA